MNLAVSKGRRSAGKQINRPFSKRTMARTPPTQDARVAWAALLGTLLLCILEQMLHGTVGFWVLWPLLGLALYNLRNPKAKSWCCPDTLRTHLVNIALYTLVGAVFIMM